MDRFNAIPGGAMNARTLALRKVDVLDVNCTARLLFSDFCEVRIEVTTAELHRVWLIASGVVQNTLL
jgi:hypothetical protein